MIEQINMFEDMYQSFKFDKKEINLFEAFAGIGSQAGNSIVVDVLYYIFKPLFDEGATI